jgi:hypothetical protein
MQKLFKNPFLNSILAESYIILIATLIRSFGKPNTPDKFFDSLAALSLFTLSAAVMGYLFLGEPLGLYLGGEKQAAIIFFFKTVFGFAFITLLIVLKVKFL